MTNPVTGEAASEVAGEAAGQARHPAWPALCGLGLAVLVGGLLRFVAIGIRPLHHDEGVNVLFLLDLIRKGHYRYDPANYHGPLLYYMVAPVLSWLDSVLGVRLWPALLGSLVPLGLWPLRRLVGDWGVVLAAWLVALSPVSVYFARDLIHETWLVACAVLVGTSLCAFARSRAEWLLVAAWTGAALLIATKETAPIVLFALAMGGACASVRTGGLGSLTALAGQVRRHRRAHAIGILVAGAVLLLLFSSFFSNPQGFVDMFRAYLSWTRTGVDGTGHEKEFGYFFELLWRYERIALVLGLAGLVVAALRGDPALGFGVAGVVLLGAHSVIPYKTPWLAVGFVPALALSAGYLFDRALASARSPRWRLLLAVAVAAQLPLLGFDAYRVSFVDYDDDRETFVYSQTERGFLDLVVSVDAVAAVHPAGTAVPIHVMSPDHFPLNWYLRHYTEIGYWERVEQDFGDGLLIVKRSDLEILTPKLRIEHRSQVFPLRPGVEICLVIPGELFEQARAGLPAPGRWQRIGSLRRLAALPPSQIPTVLGAGLAARHHPGADFETPTGALEIGLMPQFDVLSGGEASWQAPHGIEWSGFLQAPGEGLYTFGLESDDGSFLEIDGVMIIDNWGEHARRKRSHSVVLVGGFHRLRLRYVDYGGGANLRFTWLAPGSRAEVPVPMTVLAHQGTADHESTRVVPGG